MIKDVDMLKALYDSLEEQRACRMQRKLNSRELPWRRYVSGNIVP